MRVASYDLSYDSGRTISTSYVAGIRTERVDSAENNVVSWHRKTYDYDDGPSQIKTPPAGPSDATTTRLDSSDAFGWASTVKTYDLAGDSTRQVRTNDNGTVLTTGYFASLRVRNDRVDASDAHRIESTYANGVIKRRIATDTMDASGWDTNVRTFDCAGPRAWDKVTSAFDADNDVLIYRHVQMDDGRQSFVGMRGLDVVAGGTTATVSADAAAQLHATGTIDLVDGYPGVTDFVEVTWASGNNGYGTFADADGSWSDLTIQGCSGRRADFRRCGN